MVVMPNHVHLLVTPCSGYALSRIIHSLKSYTAQEANKLLAKKGKFWMSEYFDRFIRDAKHFAQTVAYIENNPVKAHLCKTAQAWPFSSARFRANRT
jgi:REP element-mobilizing transposase RayT